MKGIRFMLPSLRIRLAKCEARFSVRWLQSFWEHVLYSQYLASNVSTLQFASLDVYETAVFYVKLDYPWSECTRIEYRCVPSAPCK
jgi:hypothetical protein